MDPVIEINELKAQIAELDKQKKVSCIIQFSSFSRMYTNLVAQRGLVYLK